jgi:hypothetical protein
MLGAEEAPARGSARLRSRAKRRAFDTTRGPSLPPLSSDRAAENEQEQDMNQIDENAWVKAREEEIEKMWTETLPPAHPAEIPENELPY